MVAADDLQGGKTAARLAIVGSSTTPAIRPSSPTEMEWRMRICASGIGKDTIRSPRSIVVHVLEALDGRIVVLITAVE